MSWMPFISVISSSSPPSWRSSWKLVVSWPVRITTSVSSRSSVSSGSSVSSWSSWTSFSVSSFAASRDFLRARRSFFCSFFFCSFFLLDSAF